MKMARGLNTDGNFRRVAGPPYKNIHTYVLAFFLKNQLHCDARGYSRYAALTNYFFGLEPFLVINVASWFTHLF